MGNYQKLDFLYSASAVFILLTVVLIISTYYTLKQKKNKVFFKHSIQESIERWITEIIINDNSSLIVPEGFADMFTKNVEARQIVIDELVRNKSSFLGGVSDNIIKLYYQLGLNVDSRIKLDDRRSHILCQGIHELAVMEQKDQLLKVYRFTNSEDKDVRIEAQTAILQWYGFKGLRFLEVISYPITEFQQLKLLELLRQLPFTQMPKLEKWLQSKNDTVVLFALKLAEHYKQVQVRKEAERCLYSENEAIRLQAVKTMVIIGDESTAGVLTAVYKNERFTNRLNILKELQKIAGDEETSFLVYQLNEGNPYLKLEAAKALAKCTTEGMEILETASQAKVSPYSDIYLHVKSEMS